MATAQAQARWRLKIAAANEAREQGATVLDFPLVKIVDGRVSTWTHIDGWVSVEDAP